MVSDRYEDKDTHLIPNRNRSPQPIFRHRHSLPGILPRHFSSVRAPSPFSGRLRPSHSLAPRSLPAPNAPPARYNNKFSGSPEVTPRSLPEPNAPATNSCGSGEPRGPQPSGAEARSSCAPRRLRPSRWNNQRRKHPTATRSL